MAEVQPGPAVGGHGEIAAECGEPAAVGDIHFAGICTEDDRCVGGHFEYRGVRIIVRGQLDLVSGRDPAQRAALDDDRRIGRVVRTIHDQRAVGGAVQADDDVEVAGQCAGYSTALEVPDFADGFQSAGQRSAGEGEVVDRLARTHCFARGRKYSAGDDFHVVTCNAGEVGQGTGIVDAQDADVQRRGGVGKDHAGRVGCVGAERHARGDVQGTAAKHRVAVDGGVDVDVCRTAAEVQAAGGQRAVDVDRAALVDKQLGVEFTRGVQVQKTAGADLGLVACGQLAVEDERSGSFHVHRVAHRVGDARVDGDGVTVDRRQCVAVGDSRAGPRRVGLPEAVRLVVEARAERFVDDQAVQPDRAAVVGKAQVALNDAPVGNLTDVEHDAVPVAVDSIELEDLNGTAVVLQEVDARGVGVGDLQGPVALELQSGVARAVDDDKVAGVVVQADVTIHLPLVGTARIGVAGRRVAVLEPQPPLVVGRVERHIHRADARARREDRTVMHADFIPGVHVTAYLDFTVVLEIDTLVVAGTLGEVALDSRRAGLQLEPAVGARIVAVDDEFVVDMVVQQDAPEDGHVIHELHRAAVVHLDILVIGVVVIAGYDRVRTQFSLDRTTARVACEIPRVDAEIIDVGQLRSVEFDCAVASDIEDIEIVPRTTRRGPIRRLLRVVPDPDLAVAVVAVDVIGQGHHRVGSARTEHQVTVPETGVHVIPLECNAPFEGDVQIVRRVAGSRRTPRGESAASVVTVGTPSDFSGTAADVSRKGAVGLDGVHRGRPAGAAAEVQVTRTDTGAVQTEADRTRVELHIAVRVAGVRKPQRARVVQAVSPLPVVILRKLSAQPVAGSAVENAGQFEHVLVGARVVVHMDGLAAVHVDVIGDLGLVGGLVMTALQPAVVEALVAVVPLQRPSRFVVTGEINRQIPADSGETTALAVPPDLPLGLSDLHVQDAVAHQRRLVAATVRFQAQVPAVGRVQRVYGHVADIESAVVDDGVSVVLVAAVDGRHQQAGDGSFVRITVQVRTFVTDPQFARTGQVGVDRVRRADYLGFEVVEVIVGGDGLSGGVDRRPAAGPHVHAIDSDVVGDRQRAPVVHGHHGVRIGEQVAKERPGHVQIASGQCQVTARAHDFNLPVARIAADKGERPAAVNDQALGGYWILGRQRSAVEGDHRVADLQFGIAGGGHVQVKPVEGQCGSHFDAAVLVGAARQRTAGQNQVLEKQRRMIVDDVAGDLQAAAAVDIAEDLERVSVGGLEPERTAGQRDVGSARIVQRDGQRSVSGPGLVALARGQRPAAVYLDGVVVRAVGQVRIACQNDLAAGEFQKRTVAVGVRAVHADQTPALDVERRAGAHVLGGGPEDQVAVATLDDRRGQGGEVDARGQLDVCSGVESGRTGARRVGQRDRRERDILIGARDCQHAGACPVAEGQRAEIDVPFLGDRVERRVGSHRQGRGGHVQITYDREAAAKADDALGEQPRQVGALEIRIEDPHVVDQALELAVDEVTRAVSDVEELVALLGVLVHIVSARAPSGHAVDIHRQHVAGGIEGRHELVPGVVVDGEVRLRVADPSGIPLDIGAAIIVADHHVPGSRIVAGVYRRPTEDSALVAGIVGLDHGGNREVGLEDTGEVGEISGHVAPVVAVVGGIGFQCFAAEVSLTAGGDVGAVGQRTVSPVLHDVGNRRPVLGIEVIVGQEVANVRRGPAAGADADPQRTAVETDIRA